MMKKGHVIIINEETHATKPFHCSASTEGEDDETIDTEIA